VASLNTYVHVEGVAYGPGDDIPDDVAAKILNPDVWAVPPEPVRQGTGAMSGGSVVVNVIPRVAVPPRSGPGSGRAVWVAYAQDNGVEVTDDLKTRDDIIAACDLAGVPTGPVTE
jgi:hypothetical protein